MSYVGRHGRRGRIQEDAEHLASTLGRVQGMGGDDTRTTGVTLWSNDKTQLWPMAIESMEIYNRRLEGLMGYLLCSFIDRDASGQSAVCMNGELR